MQQKVNYILHLNKAFQRFYQDHRLTPFHISLYYSLFQYWNIAKFNSPISISRSDQMQASKIGSVNTYLKCLKELDAWGYIRYLPSHNPMKGSLVHLFTFDNTTHTTTKTTPNTTTDNGTDNTSHTTRETTPETLVRPSINSLNKPNKLKAKANGHEKKSARFDEDFNLSEAKSASKNRTDSGEKKEFHAGARQKNSASPAMSRIDKKGHGGTEDHTDHPAAGFKRPVLQLVKKYFEKQQWPAIEGQKFFNHYESVGWLVGGKSPMQNWQASAANWMIKSGNFKTQPDAKPGNIHVKQDKDYSEPL